MEFATISKKYNNFQNKLHNYFQNIFKRFERRSTTVGGFGIGLDIVNSVCEMYHINVWIESIPNKETTFHLQFPHV